MYKAFPPVNKLASNPFQFKGRIASGRTNHAKAKETAETTQKTGLAEGRVTDYYPCSGNGWRMVLALTGAAFKLVNGNYEMEYSVMTGTNKGNSVSSGTEVALNDTILSWTYGDAEAVVSTDLRIHVASSELEGLAAGAYTDTLTFTASVSGN